MKYTIHHGTQRPAVAVGRNQCHALAFAEKYRGWHTIGKDKATRRAIEGLRRRGCIVVSPSTNQFRFNG